MPPKRQMSQDPHGVTSQKTAFFIVTTVKTKNLTPTSSLGAFHKNIKQLIPGQKPDPNDSKDATTVLATYGTVMYALPAIRMVHAERNGYSALFNNIVNSANCRFSCVTTAVARRQKARRPNRKWCCLCAKSIICCNGERCAFGFNVA
jgi:hypothetical protein